jgi:hypothetical protein
MARHATHSISARLLASDGATFMDAVCTAVQRLRYYVLAQIKRPCRGSRKFLKLPKDKAQPFIVIPWLQSTIGGKLQLVLAADHDLRPQLQSAASDQHALCARKYLGIVRSSQVPGAELTCDDANRAHLVRHRLLSAHSRAAALQRHSKLAGVAETCDKYNMLHGCLQIIDDSS